MKVKSVYCFLAIIFFIFQNNSRSLAMEKKDLNLSFISFISLKSVDVEKIDRLKLLNTADSVKLFFSETRSTGNGFETVISSVPISQTNLPSVIEFTIPQILPPPPYWDISIGIDMSNTIVYEQFGGAFNKLFAKSKAGLELFVSSHFQDKSFRQPRFIHRDQILFFPPVIAIAEEDQIAGFIPSMSEGYKNYKELGKGIAAVARALGEDYLLCYKTRKPGSIRLPNIPQGRLHMNRMDSAFDSKGLPISFLEETSIFEFDLDVSENRAVIFATTADGLVLVVGSLKEKEFEWIIYEKKGEQAEWLNPTLLISKDKIYLTAIEVSPEQPRKLVTAIISQSDLSE
jgi:hypothetical protein